MKNTRLGAAVLALALGVGGALAFSGPASAHTGGATAVASCPAPSVGTGKVAITVTNDHPLVATVTASDNAAIAVGATIPKTGSKTFTVTVPAPAAGVTSSAKIDLRWSDGFTQSGITASATVGADCTGPATVVVPDLPVTPPTCTADGGLPFTANPAAQNPNGYEFPGQGFRVYLSPAYTGPGTYTATVQKVGAGFDAAFPNGTKVTGNLTQTLTVLPAIGNQTADADAPCYTRPEVPAPDVKVGEWTDQVGTPSCDVDYVLTTRTTVTTPYIWDEETGEYVADTEHAVTTIEDGQRDKTPAEVEDCAVVTPPTEEPTPPTDEPTPPTDEPSLPSDGPTEEPNPGVTPTAKPTAPAAELPSDGPTEVAVTVPTDDTTPPTAAKSLAYTGSDLLAVTPYALGALALGALGLVLLNKRRNRTR